MKGMRWRGGDGGEEMEGRSGGEEMEGRRWGGGGDEEWGWRGRGRR